jgi:hypothetical protein
MKMTVQSDKKAKEAGFDTASGVTVKVADVTKPPECDFAPPLLVLM